MKKLVVESPDTLLNIVQQMAGLNSTSKARKVIKTGHVTVDQKVIKIPGGQIKKGQEVTLLNEPVVEAISGAPAPFKVIFENADFLVYEKPSGLSTASPKPKLRTTYSLMKDWMLQRNPDERDLHFVNKVERDASGLVMIAKSLKWRKYLQTNWETFVRGYYLVVQGRVPDDGQVQPKRKKGQPEPKPGEKYPFRSMKTNQQFALIRIRLEHGQEDRFEAIFAKNYLPILGVKGTKDVPNPLKRKAKHLFELNIPHPDKKETIKVQTPVPREFLNLIKSKS
jgi:23S rRNA pseudouridine1911/1915/1917 synthase